MARAGSLLLLLLKTCLPIGQVLGLYEDQAGKLDWTKENIGAIKGVIYEGKRLYVWSDAKVVGAVSARTGTIEWRSVLPSSVESVDAAVVHNGRLVTLTGGGRQLWAWRTSDGALLWDVNLSTQSSSHASSAGKKETVPCTPRLLVTTGSDASSAYVAVTSCSGTGVYGVEDGEEVEAEDGGPYVLPEGFQAVDAVSVGGGAVAVVGQVKGEGRVLLVHGEKRQVLKVQNSDTVPKGSSVQWASLVNPTTLHVLVSSPDGSTVALHRIATSSLGLQENANNLRWINGPLAVTESGTVVELRVEGDRVKGKVVVAPQTASGSSGAYAYAADHAFVSGPEAVNIVHVPTATSVGSLPLSSVSGKALRIFPQLFDNKSTGGKGFRALVIDQYHTTAMVQQSRTVWVREEGLTQVDSVAFVDYIPEHLLEGTGLDQHHLPTLEERLRMQVRKLQGLWQWARDEAQALVKKQTKSSTQDDEDADPGLVSSPSDHSNVDARAIKFGLSKLAILTTSLGRMVAIHLSDGKVAWTFTLPLRHPQDTSAVGSNTAMKRKAWAIRVARAAPQMGYLPELLAVSKWGEAIWLDAATGKEVRHEDESSSGEVAQLVPLEVTGEDGSHDVLLVSKDNRARFCGGKGGPEAMALVEKGQLFFNRLDKQQGLITSYQVLPPSGAPGAYWPMGSEVVASAKIPDGETIVAVEYPNPLEVIASAAQVLGDQALLLKYLNPHVLAIATTALTKPKKQSNSTTSSTPLTGAVADVPTLHITLMDTVSCRVLHRTTHFHAMAPVSLLLVENWVLYSYWNTRAQRTEVGSVSYYDGFIDKNSLNPFNQPEQKASFSSLDGDIAPLGLQKTFIFPRPITCLGATNTARGIASKAILFGMEPGAIFSLDRRALDPRRPVGEPTPAEKAEGLMPYAPHLPIIPPLVLTYNRTIHGLRHIYTVPAKLESTSLLLAVGLDVWATRVYPSKTFDILSNDFNYVLVTMILLGLVVAVSVLRRWARQKTLYDSWQ